MPALDEWAVRLALIVAPEEVDLAPGFARAYAAGGRQRQELFASARGVTGGFTPGDGVTIMPYVLQAVAAVGTALVAVLSSEQA